MKNHCSFLERSKGPWIGLFIVANETAESKQGDQIFSPFRAIDP
jgi:hypothetical protein